MSTKYPVPVTAVKSTVLIEPVSHDTTPVPPKPVDVPKFCIVAPEGIVNVSPLSPSCVVPQATLGVILFTLFHS